MEDNKKQYQNLKGTLILVLTSLIWGLAFVAQDVAADHVSAFWFNGIRSAIGAVALFLYLFIRRAVTKKMVFPKEPEDRKKVLIAGLICGIFLTVSVNLQQWGIMLYPEGVPTAARGSFITALYVVMVPLVSTFTGKRPSIFLWAAVAVAVAGVYLLCLSDGIEGIYLGDLLMFLCAMSFTGHILTIDKWGNHVDSILLSATQFVVCAVLSSVLGLLFEAPLSPAGLLPALPAILYVGIFSSGVAYTLQIVGQRFAEPTVASISMSLESVFGALGGWLISHNVLTIPELFGCILVFTATILAQIPDRR